MRRTLSLLSLLAFLLPAAAEAQDVRALVDRIDRLQRDIDTLQRQVYRGQVPQTSIGGAPMAPPLGSPPPVASGSGDLSAAAVSRFETRVSQLEDILRDLTGKMEEISYANEQTRRQLDKLSGDIDVRFTQLEQNRAPAQAQAAPPAGQQQAAVGPAPATTSGNLGSMTQGQLQANAPQVPAQATPGRPATPPQQAARTPAPAASILPDGSPEDQYKFAFNILLQNDYDQAERAFRAYIDKHPSDSRTENARYWLAETFYVRDKFEPASTAFAEAYQKAPNGQKAPDNLLKLGMSLAKLNKPREACATFDRLGQQFPNAPGTIKSRATAEKTRLNCR
ncbi:MAG: tol-pal system protein YbgF [Alphaproteobacteria bacterium]|nr:tol-pal system protein YbgF [Alphaproteobacteria bacterium]